MIQFQEHTQKEGRMDGRTDRPYFIGPFQLLQGVQKREDRNVKIYISQEQKELFR